MIKWIKAKYDLSVASKQFEQKSLDLAIKQLEEATKLAKLDDDTGWDVLYSGGQSVTGGVLSESNLETAREQSRKFARWNPHARGVLRSLSKFVIGRGVTFAPKFSGDKIDKKLVEQYVNYWDAWVKIEKFRRKQKESVRRLTRDGEFFLRSFEDVLHGYLKIRFLEPDRIKNPSGYNEKSGLLDGKQVRGNLTYGIETSRKDIENVFFYYYETSGDPGYIRIPAKQVIHKKLFADSNRKRGFPFLETMLYDCKTYRDWLKDRVVLNKIRTAIALVREIDPTMGTKSQVQGIRDQERAQTSGIKSSKMQLPEPGTMITARGVNYKFLTPDLDAKDSAEDGRHILLSIAAGSGLAEYMVTGDASNANYSSSMVAESPAVKEFEDIQDELQDCFIEIYDNVIAFGRKHSKDLPSVGPTPECDLTFPVLINRDVKREADAFGLYDSQRIMSKKTIRGKLGLNNEIENENLKTEKSDELDWNSYITHPDDNDNPEEE